MQGDHLPFQEAWDRAFPYLVVYRSQISYRRTADGGFDPPTVQLHTWVWHRVTVASERYWEWCRPEPGSDGTVVIDFELPSDGSIDQYERAFRFVREQSDKPGFDYSLSEIGWIPVKMTIETPVWHELCQLASTFERMSDELEKYKPKNWNIDPDTVKQ